MSLAKPARNEQYANYLFGLGVGLVLGSMFSSDSHQPSKTILTAAVIDLVLAITIYYWANTKGKK